MDDPTTGSRKADEQGTSTLDKQTPPGEGSMSSDEIWARIGKDFFNGIDKLSEETGIPVAKLVTYLQSEAETESRSRRRRAGWLKRHWLDVSGLLLATVILLLILRGFFGWGLKPTVVADRRLEPARPIHIGDVHGALLPGRANYFASPKDVDGLMLNTTVPEGKPLRFSDVLRLQVIATRDIRAGDVFGPDDATLSWTAYEKQAFVTLSGVVGRVARRAIHRGDVIVAEVVDGPETAPCCVRVAAAGGLPAFHVLTPSDLKEPVSGTSPDAQLRGLINRYTLKAIGEGATIGPDQVSRYPLSRDEVQAILGREILSIPVDAAIPVDALEEGTRVTLYFSPRSGGGERPFVCGLRDVLLLSMDRKGDTVSSIVVALSKADMRRVAPILSTSDVLVTREIH